MINGWSVQALEGSLRVMAFVCFIWDSRAVFASRNSAPVATMFQMVVKESPRFCLFLVSSFRKEKKWKEEGREDGEK